MSTTWKINTLDRRTSDGFVTTAHWAASAMDGEHTASVYGTCGWSEGQPIVPYADLTEQQVLGWCWDSGVDKAATEQALADQIAAAKAPASTAGVPWASQA